MSDKQKYVTYTKSPTPEPVVDGRFKITRAKIKEMYESDTSIKRNVNKTTNTAATINTLTTDTLNSYYYNLTVELENQRRYSNELYTFYPIYAGLLDYLSNMYLWRYTYVPRIVKEKAGASDYKEIYDLMGEVVDGISIETTFPMILTELYINGAVFLITNKNTSSKTIATISLPTKYCRVNAVTQYGTYTFQFDFSYFDSLSLSKEELAIIWNYYPKEMQPMYNAYLTDKTNLRWQQLDPKYAAAFMLNKNGFPTRLRAIFSILQYDQYLNNELERNGQLLDKIISHKFPTWEDKLVVEIDEMAELHKSIANILSRNNHVRLVTTFGDMNVLSIGQDVAQENKTLDNAYNSIYDNSGENHTLFNGTIKEALTYALQRDQSTTWKYVQQLVNFYNLTINNSFNFKGYQCDLTILPITTYNEQEKITLYKEGATLGVTKLEYIVSTGVKQINLESKFTLEDYLKLDQLKPLSTSYTQNDNSKTANPEDETEENPTDETDMNIDEVEGEVPAEEGQPADNNDAADEPVDNGVEEQEVNNNEKNTE